MNAPTVFPLPRGKTNEELYQHARTLIDTLRRFQSADPQSLADLEALVTTMQTALDAAEAAIAQLQEDVGGISSGGLTPQQVFLLERFAGGRDLLASGLAIATDAMEWAQTAGEAGLENLIQIEELATGIRVFQRTIHTETLSLAQQITAVQASLGVTNAAIVTEQTARVNGDNANAASISTVSSTVAGLSSQVTTIQSAVDGVEAHYGILLQAGNRFGFFKMDGTTAEVNAVFGVDKFVIMHPSSTGVTAAPFVVGLVDGVSTVAINGALVVDGSIIARHIGAGEITAGKIAAGAITADKLSVSTLSAIVANLGTVTTGKIESTDGKLLIDAGTTKRIRILS